MTQSMLCGANLLLTRGQHEVFLYVTTSYMKQSNLIMNSALLFVHYHNTYIWHWYVQTSTESAHDLPSGFSYVVAPFSEPQEKDKVSNLYLLTACWYIQ